MPEDLAASGFTLSREGRLSETERRANAALATRGETVSNGAGALPVVVRQAIEVQLRPELNEDADQLGRADRLLDTLVVEPRRPALAREARKDVVLQGRLPPGHP